MKIGILVAGHVPEELKADYQDYGAVFARFLGGQGFEFATYHVVDMEFPASVEDADGWLISGSRHGVYEDHDFIPPLEDFVRQCQAQDVPMVGICFGHQIIAQALGGKVIKYPGGWAVGRQSYDLNGQDLHVNAWHQDQVVTPPEGATTLAGNAFCEHAALAYGNSMFTLQPHPEFEKGFTNGLLVHRAPGLVPDDLISEATDQLDAPIHDTHLAQTIGAFFKTRQLSELAKI